MQVCIKVLPPFVAREIKPPFVARERTRSGGGGGGGGVFQMTLSSVINVSEPSHPAQPAE